MRRRLLLGYLSLTLFVLLVLEIPLGVSFAQRELERLLTRVERDAFALASFAEDHLEGTTQSDLQGLADGYADRTGGRAVIVDADGIGLADSDPPAPGRRSFATRPEIVKALEGRVATGERLSETLSTNLVFVAVPVASGGEVHGAVRITYPRSTVDTRIRDNWLRLAGVGVVSLGAATVVGLAFARGVARPLRDLQSTATALGRGDLGARAPAGAGPPEVQALATAFNDTATRLEVLVGSQEQFVADASHQLRTPLAALRLRLENLASECTSDTDDVEAALAEVARLSRLVDGLLALARADRTGATATAVAVHASDALAERIDAWEAMAADQGVRLARRDATDLLVVATPDRLSQALDNLIANAFDASPAGGAVTLSCESAGGWVDLHVVDEGPGMSEEERQRAFDRFWRARHTEARLGGTGLGLSIVQKLVRADGGDVELREAPGGGLDAVIRLRAALGAGGHVVRGAKSPG